MKLNKKTFLKTELGSNLIDCIIAWDMALENMRKYSCYTDKYKREKQRAYWCQAQWEVYQIMLRQFYGVEYYFTRTDTYCGICSEMEDFLIKKERQYTEHGKLYYV